MSRRIHCQDALMTQTLGWQHWGNTTKDILNAGACYTDSLTWFKRARVRQILLVTAGWTGEI